jgi:hypothetical protein
MHDGCSEANSPNIIPPSQASISSLSPIACCWSPSAMAHYKHSNVLLQTVPMLRRLVAGFPPRWPGFDPRPSHVGFVVNKAALWQVSEYFGFPCKSFHRLLHNHPSSADGTTGQIVAAVHFVSAHPKKQKKPPVGWLVC